MRFTCSENEGIAALLLRKYVKSYIDHSIAFHLNGWNISIIIMSHTISYLIQRMVARRVCAPSIVITRTIAMTS